jgi:glycerol-3-phosphate acyltransferase PlsY
MPTIENTFTVLALWAAIGYLLGSVPFGMVVARVMNLGNLREIGSGNIGATNVLRTGNKTDAAQLAAVMAMIGHCFPVWLSFQGGKGVATFLGIMLAYALPVGLACCAAWLVGAFLWRISSMGALFSASISTIILLVLGSGTALIMGFILTIVIFYRHRENIQRVRNGTEPKIGAKKD